MYRVLERNVLVWVLCVLVGASFLINVVLYQPGEDFAVWRRVIFTTPGTFGLLTLLLGATPAWRKLWEWFPKLSEWVYPDLNGEWHTMMHSNIKSIAEYHPNFKDVVIDTLNSEVPGKFQISQNWFRIFIRFDSADRYTTSNTTVVQPKRDPETGRFSLTYVYRADTIDPKPTDEQHHFGAAALEISPDFKELRGPYWTNRNHKTGLNTAGTLSATRDDANNSNQT